MLSWLLQAVLSVFSPTPAPLPLGYQSRAVPLEQVSGFLSPEAFFNDYVVHGRPIVFKGALTYSAACLKWSDEYFLEQPESGEWMVGYEIGKKETRQGYQEPIPFSEYIKRYRKEDLYCVTGLPRFLRDDLPVYDALNCGFILDNLMDDLVMWFSSGGTRSVWHYDDYENLNCLIQGRKELILANRSQLELGYFDVPDGSYSSVDVDAVDLTKYPTFADVRFYNATIESGDCVYIPSFWGHTVKSFDRNIAINAWWDLYKTPITCNKEDKISSWSRIQLITDSDIGPKSSPQSVDTENGRGLAATLRLSMWFTRSMRTEGILPREEFLDTLEEFIQQGEDHEMDIEMFAAAPEETWSILFTLLDTNRDGVLQPVEVDLLKDDETVERYVVKAGEHLVESKREL